MLVDVSGSVRWVLADEREAAGRFFDTVLRPSDHALLLGFSSTLVLWQDFTPSSERLRNALAQLACDSVPRPARCWTADAGHAAVRCRLSNREGQA